MLNDNVFYTTKAVCSRYKINQDIIDEMVSWGVADPSGHEPDKWLFSQKDFDRIGQASRFNKELEINIPGAALALQLLDEINHIRNKER